MKEEYDALTLNKTWTLVPSPPGANIVSGNGFFATNITLMVLSPVTKPVGLFAVSLNSMASIMMRLLALLLNPPPFAQFFP